MQASSIAQAHNRVQQWHSHKACSCSVRAAAVAPTQHTGPYRDISSNSLESASSITTRITHASSTTQLLQLHATHRGRLDAIHYAALFNRLMQAADASQLGSISQSYAHLQGSLLHDQEQHQEQEMYQQQGLYHHHHQQQQQQQHRQQLLRALVADLPHIIPILQPGPLVVVLRSTVKLSVQPQPQLLLALLHHAHKVLGFDTFGPRELCTLAHALAELQPVSVPWTVPAVAAAAADARMASSHQPQQQQQQRCSAALHSVSSSSSGGIGIGSSSGSGSSRSSSSTSSSSSWDPVLLQDMFYALGRSLPQCNAQDAAQAILAVSKLHWLPSEAWLRMWLLRSTQLLPNFTPQGLANAAYGLVRALQLQGQLPSSIRHEWAQRGSSPCASAQHQQQQQQQRQQHKQQQQLQQQQGTLLQAAHTWLRQCLSVSALHLHTLKPQELIGQLLWAAGKLSRTCALPEPAMHRLLTAAQEMLPACEARHLSAAMYAFSLLNHSPDRATCWVLWGCLSRQVLDLSVRDLSEVLWAAGKLQLQPPAVVRRLLQQQALLLLGGQPQHELFGPPAAAAAAAAEGQGSASQQQRISSRDNPSVRLLSVGYQALYPRHVVGVLRGMVGLGWQLQEKYVVRFETVFLDQLESCTPQDISNTLWALATAGVQVETRWLDRVLMAASIRLDQFNPQDLSNTLGALAQLQHTPSKPWMQQFLLFSLQQMSSFVAADFTQTLCGLSKLGYSPSPLWLNSFWSNSGQCLTDSNFSAAEIHVLLLAAVELEVQPPQKWVQVAAGAVERGLAGFGSQQLLEVLRALQHLTQAGERTTAAAAAAAGVTAAAAKTALVVVGSSSSSGMVSVGGGVKVPAAKWISSCIVPINSSSSSRAGLRGSSLQLQLQQPEQGADLLPSFRTHSSSGSSSRIVLKVKYPPGLVRLRRQVYHSQVYHRKVTVAGRGLLRPVWPSNSHHSLSASAAAAAATSSSGSSRTESRYGRNGIIDTMAAQQQQQQQQQQLQIWGGTNSIADEMYSLACLVQLMPQQRRVRLERWPQWLAAERAQERGVLQLQGSRNRGVLAGV